MLAAIILSAGESTRMGSPKALVPFRGRTFLARLLDIVGALNKSEISDIRIVLGSHAEQITTALGLDPGIVVFNPNWKQGQLSSIQAAIRSLPNHTDGMILFLVDHPLISASLVEKLISKFRKSGYPLVVPTFRGKRGHPVIFAKRLYNELLDAPAEHGARAVVWAHSAEVMEVPTDEKGVLLNLNDPDTLHLALG